jgi:serpin B
MRVRSSSSGGRAGLVALLALCACSGTRTGNPGQDPEVPAGVTLAASSLPRKELQLSAADNERFTTGNRAFGWDLYRALAADGGNQVFSPYSISLALAMAYAGASGDTQSQMRQVLHFDLDEPALHEGFNQLDRQLAAPPSSQRTLLVANQAWGQKGYQFLDDYLDVLAVNYGAGLFLIDFEADAKGARQVINGWVSKQTAMHITDLLPESALDGRTRLVLSNALYLKANWDQNVAFDPQVTRPGTFHAPDGDRQVPMMNHGLELDYARGDGFALVQLPYSGDSLRMLLILPDADREQDLQNQLDGDWFVAQRAALTSTELNLSLPKWRFASAHSLREVLSALGMPDAFSDAADFSRMSGMPDLKIKEVYHEGFIGVDESGTEATAASAVVITRKHAIDKVVPLAFDHPFLFVIYDTASDAILFVGRVEDPS